LSDGYNLLFISKEFYRGRISAPVEAEWALAHPETFTPFYMNSDIIIFRVADKDG